MILREPVVRQYDDGTHELETSLYVYGELHSIDSLRDRFIATGDYYQKMLQIAPRFSEMYGWNDLEKFVEKFGDDMTVATHGPYQARTIGIPMALAQRQMGSTTIHHLTPTEEMVSVAHHVQHDDEEAVHGDVAYDQRTDEHAQVAFQTFCEIQEEVFGIGAAKKHLATVKRFDNPNAKKDSFKRRYWNAGERAGYYATAVLAHHLYNWDNELTAEERSKSHKLAAKVGPKHAEVLEQRRDFLPFIDRLLTESAPVLREMKKMREKL